MNPWYARLVEPILSRDRHIERRYARSDTHVDMSLADIDAVLLCMHICHERYDAEQLPWLLLAPIDDI